MCNQLKVLVSIDAAGPELLLRSAISNITNRFNGARQKG